MKLLHALAATLLFATPLFAQATVNPPAAMEQMILPSHGSNLLGVFYLAGGAGPHPTAIIFHGFPGFEQNLDIAQDLRAHGWNVLAMHYRGSWGVKGNFSFAHAAEDADTQVRFLLDPANAQKYRIDPHRIVVIGHSMGGYMAASVIAHNPQVAAAVLISAWNISRGYKNRRRPGEAPLTVKEEAEAIGLDNNLAPLAGTSGLALARIPIRNKARASMFAWLLYLPGYGLLALAHSLWLALAGAFFAATGQSSSVVLVNSAVQEEVPDSLLGRVLGVVSLTHRGAHATGLMLVSPLFAFVAARAVFGASAIAVPLVGLIAVAAARAGATRRSR